MKIEKKTRKLTYFQSGNLLFFHFTSWFWHKQWTWVTWQLLKDRDEVGSLFFSFLFVSQVLVSFVTTPILALCFSFFSSAYYYYILFGYISSSLIFLKLLHLVVYFVYVRVLFWLTNDLLSASYSIFANLYLCTH